MTKRSLGRIGLYSALLGAATTLYSQTIDDQESSDLPARILTDSSSDWNPDGVQPDGQWQYGYTISPEDVDAFTQSHVWRTYFPGPNSWIGGEGEIWDSGGYPRSGKYAMAPSSTKDVVKRWTSNVDGVVTFSVDCMQLQNSVNDQIFSLYRNGIQEATFRKSDASHHVVFQQPCKVEVGDVLDFVIDSRNNQAGDWTFVDIRVLTDAGPDRSQLIYFPLDETNDLPVSLSPEGSIYDRRSRVADFSGNDYHATLLDMDRDSPSVNGVADQARVFDGIDDSIVTEASGVGSGLSELTLSIWVNPSSLEGSEGVIGSTGEDHFGLTFGSEEEGFPIRFSAKGVAAYAPASSAPVGEWTHVVGVWRAGAIHKIYVNGEEAGRVAIPKSTSIDVDTWVLGSDRLLPDRFFEGALDEALILPRALSGPQVRALYRENATHDSLVGPGSFFNGRSDYMAEAPAETLGASELTLSAWINPFVKNENAALISSRGNDFFALLHSGYGEGRPLEFRAKGQRLVAADYSCPTGQWNHVTGVWKSGEIQKLYINGEEVASHQSPRSGVIEIEQWLIGRDRYFEDRFYSGMLTDVQIIPQAYDAAQVAALYSENLPSGHTVGPVAAKGFLRWDYSSAVNHSTIGELVSDPEYWANTENGAFSGFIAGSSTGIVATRGTASRVRGYITAPATGDYFFWVASRRAVNLSISPDSEKYSKRRIARLSPDLGTSAGVTINHPTRWDVYYSQLSEPVSLEAGEKYYIEAFQAGGNAPDAHLALAWARPDLGVRELIPSEFISPYVHEEGDRDDDFLPDAWELQYGLDSADNGRLDVAHQGEWGDFDEDGLRNHEEYLAGTDPSLADTDGDGISDWAEVNAYQTNPAVSDVTPESIVHTVDLSAELGSGIDWIRGVDGGIAATSFRGSGSWNFSTPEDGHWIVQLSANLRGNLRFEEELPIIVSINGHVVQRTTMDFRGRVPGTLRVLTPWMPAGSHEVEIFIDNNTTRRSLQLNSITVSIPGGIDLDGSGLADWADASLSERSYGLPNNLYSHISPAMIEGVSPSQSLVDITTINRSGQTHRDQRFTEQQMQRMLDNFENRVDRYASRLQTQMRQVQSHPTWNHHNGGRMEGTHRPHTDGPGTRRWYSMLDLQPNEAVGYVAQQENLGTYHTGMIAWMPVNVFEADSLTIPAGSDLLIGAWIKEWDSKNITLEVNGEVHTFRSTQSHTEHFASAGIYTVIATHQDGETSAMTINVVDASLPGHLSVGEERFSTNSLPGVAVDLALDTNSEVPHNGLSSGPSGTQTRLAGVKPGVYNAAARLPQSEGNARSAILDQTSAYVVGVSDALRNGSDIVTPQGDGILLVRSPLLVLHLPPGATVETVIFAGGVTFTDGTTLKTLTAADFDENGIYTFEFLVPVERFGAPCHYISIDNVDGQEIWTDRR